MSCCGALEVEPSRRIPRLLPWLLPPAERPAKHVQLRRDERPGTEP